MEKKMNRKVLPEVVEIEYHYKNSVHIFTCQNDAGLVHIDSDNREEAYERIGPVLSQHFTAYCGQSVRYSPSTDYRGFCDVVAGRALTTVPNIAFKLENITAHC